MLEPARNKVRSFFSGAAKNSQIVTERLRTLIQNSRIEKIWGKNISDKNGLKRRETRLWKDLVEAARVGATLVTNYFIPGSH